MKAATFHESRRLTPADLEDFTRECPICLSTDSRQPVFRIQSDPDVDLLHCPRCYGYSASHMPRPEYLEQYYGTYYEGKDQAVTFYKPEKFARHIFRATGDVWGSRLRILDFGGGDGSLAKAVTQQFLRQHPNRRVDVLLVDFALPSDFQDERVEVRHLTSFESIEGQYDLVVASAILEHIPAVNPVFRKLLTSVAPGGFFYARTPYAYPFTKLFPKLDLTYPAHVHDMGSGFWNRVVEIFSFDGQYVASRPSLVESGFMQFPVRTLAAHVLKTPAYLEGLVSPKGRKDRLWNLVGGWEVVLKRH